MPDPVPVASNLLESKFFGLSVRRLIESMGIPIAPCAILYTAGFPLVFTLPLFIVGLGVGAVIYRKTPPGQRPLRYAHAIVKHRFGGNVYVWAPSTTLEHDLATGARQNEWLTQPPDPTAQSHAPRRLSGTADAPDNESEGRVDPLHGTAVDAREAR